MPTTTPQQQAIEDHREPSGQFGTQPQRDPEEGTLPAPAAGPVSVWAAAADEAEARVKALIPDVERAFRDQIRAVDPGTGTVTIGTSYDVEGDVSLFVSAVDDEDADDLDFQYTNAIQTLRGYGYNYERLSDMSATESNGEFVFDLDAITGDALPPDELAGKVRDAWAAWEGSAKLLEPVFAATRERLGHDLELCFEDSGDDRRVTVYSPEGEAVEDNELLDAVNTYATSLGDMTLFPGLTRDEDDMWSFCYRG